MPARGQPVFDAVFQVAIGHHPAAAIAQGIGNRVRERLPEIADQVVAGTGEHIVLRASRVRGDREPAGDRQGEQPAAGAATGQSRPTSRVVRFHGRQSGVAGGVL
jgi:hypothetical protein